MSSSVGTEKIVTEDTIRYTGNNKSLVKSEVISDTINLEFTDGVVLKTTDGGKNWEAVKQKADGSFEELGSTDKNGEFKLGGKESDGDYIEKLAEEPAAKITKDKITEKAIIYKVDGSRTDVDETHSIILDFGDGVVLKTTDCGKNWEEMYGDDEEEQKEE